ncbi:MAG TPA: hypothetical protein DIW30_03430 [Bacteroidales bacterium]|nr:hypothetical protein [Bacteroidales bacterium]
MDMHSMMLTLFLPLPRRGWGGLYAFPTTPQADLNDSSTRSARKHPIIREASSFVMEERLLLLLLSVIML